MHDLLQKLSCLLSASSKPEGTELDYLLESQNDRGTLVGSSQMSAPEDYWFFTNRVMRIVKRLYFQILKKLHVVLCG